MELTVTNRSRAYPGRSSGDSKVDGVQYVVLKVCVSRPGRRCLVFLFCANNELKSAPTRDLGDCRDMTRGSLQSVFLSGRSSILSVK